MGTPGAYKEIELRYGKKMAILLPEIFERLGSQKLVCEELDVNRVTLNGWLKDLNMRGWTVLRPRQAKEHDDI